MRAGNIFRNRLEWTSPCYRQLDFFQHLEGFEPSLPPRTWNICLKTSAKGVRSTLLFFQCIAHIFLIEVQNLYWHWYEIYRSNHLIIEMFENHMLFNFAYKFYDMVRNHLQNYLCWCKQVDGLSSMPKLRKTFWGSQLSLTDTNDLVSLVKLGCYVQQSSLVTSPDVWNRYA